MVNLGPNIFWGRLSSGIAPRQKFAWSVPGTRYIVAISRSWHQFFEIDISDLKKISSIYCHFEFIFLILLQNDPAAQK